MTAQDFADHLFIALASRLRDNPQQRDLDELKTRVDELISRRPDCPEAPLPLPSDVKIDHGQEM
jgi:hypothetical protein